MGGAKLSMVVALAASVLVGGRAASAYCLLVPDPGSSVINLMSCTTDPAGGVTWEYACAEIGINPDGLPVGMTLSSFRAAVYAAANTWNAARCTGGAAPAFQFVTYPDVDAPFGFNPSSTNANLISFRSPWPSDAAHIPGAAAVVGRRLWGLVKRYIPARDITDVTPLRSPNTSRSVLSPWWNAAM